jgi:hypothetical protein
MNALPTSLQSTQFAGIEPDRSSARTVSLKIGGYDLSSGREGEIPNIVDDAFLKRKSGVFGFPLLEQSDHLGFGNI